MTEIRVYRETTITVEPAGDRYGWITDQYGDLTESIDTYSSAESAFEGAEDFIDEWLGA